MKYDNNVHGDLLRRIIAVLLASKRGDGSFVGLQPKIIVKRVNNGYCDNGLPPVKSNSVRARINKIYHRDRIINRTPKGAYYVSDEDKARQFLANASSVAVRCGADKDFPQGRGWLFWFFLEHDYRWFCVDEIWRGVSQVFPSLTRKTVSQWLYRSGDLVQCKTRGGVKYFRRKGDEGSASRMCDLASPMKKWVGENSYEHLLGQKVGGEVCGEVPKGVQLFESEVPSTDYLDNSNSPTLQNRFHRKGRVQLYRKDENPQVRVSKYRSIFPLVGGCHGELVELLFRDPVSGEALGHSMNNWFQFERRFVWRDGVVFDLSLTTKTFQLVMLPQCSYDPEELFATMEQYRDEFLQQLYRDFGRTFCGHGRVVWKEVEFEVWSDLASDYIDVGFRSDSKVAFIENMRLWKYGDRSRSRFSPEGLPDVGASTPQGISSESRKARRKAKVYDELFGEEYNRRTHNVVLGLDDRIDFVEEQIGRIERLQKAQLDWMENESRLRQFDVGNNKEFFRNGEKKGDGDDKYIGGYV